MIKELVLRKELLIVCLNINIRTFSLMAQIFQNEINLLCVGDLLSGKSSFLEDYTHSKQ